MVLLRELITFCLLPCFKLIICRISKAYSLVIYDLHICTRASRLVGNSQIGLPQGWVLGLAQLRSSTIFIYIFLLKQTKGARPNSKFINMKEKGVDQLMKDIKRVKNYKYFDVFVRVVPLLENAKAMQKQIRTHRPPLSVAVTNQLCMGG